MIEIVFEQAINEYIDDFVICSWYKLIRFVLFSDQWGLCSIIICWNCSKFFQLPNLLTMVIFWHFIMFQYHCAKWERNSLTKRIRDIQYDIYFRLSIVNPEKNQKIDHEEMHIRNGHSNEVFLVRVKCETTESSFIPTQLHSDKWLVLFIVIG